MRDGDRCRPFTVADAMILVAATSAAIAYVRSPEIVGQCSALLFERHRRVWERMSAILRIASIFAVAWTFAWLILRLRRPRPSHRRLVRQPGMASCLSVAAALILNASDSVAYYLLSGSPVNLWEVPRVVVNLVGFAPLGAWLVLAAGGLCRREAGWIDRAGTSLGAFWVGLLFAHSVNYHLPYIFIFLHIL